MQLRYMVFLSGSLLLFAGLRSQCAEVDRASAEITRHGGRVKVDETAPGKPVVTVLLSYCTITDDLLALLRNFPELRTLDLGGAKISDKTLAHLKDCPKLRTL